MSVTGMTWPTEGPREKRGWTLGLPLSRLDDANNDNDRNERRNSRFCTISLMSHKLSPIVNTYARVARAQSCANHIRVQHITRALSACNMSCAT